MTVSEVVLVVDHDPRVRTALAGLLEATERMSVVAVSPDQAALVEASPDLSLAIIDVQDATDPAMDLVRRLSRRLPVIAVSMRASLRGLVEAAGAAAFVEKSGDPSAIHDAIVEVSAGRREEPRT